MTYFDLYSVLVPSWMQRIAAQAERQRLNAALLASGRSRELLFDNAASDAFAYMFQYINGRNFGPGSSLCSTK